MLPGPSWRTKRGKFPSLFGAPARVVPGRKFHYNTASAICQAKNYTKIKELFIPHLYNITC